MNLINTVGFRLREERAKLGVTQAELAEFAGVTKQTQSLYETNNRKPDTAYLAAVAAQGVDVSYVITGNRTIPLQSETLSLNYNELEIVTLYRASPPIAQKMIRATLRESATYNHEVTADTPNRMQGNDTMHRVHTF